MKRNKKYKIKYHRSYIMGGVYFKEVKKYMRTNE
jgi:hypothetical protein